ncbi:MAG: glycosyltransferase family 1 protein [Salinivirgaceae bacterium]|nr:glycosyltransferase family 1 protein [Salinivirgaceae bacterium]
MEIEQVFTRRNSIGQNYAQPIIYEWEDEISKEMMIPLLSYPSFYKAVNRFKIHSSLIGPSNNTFRFVINGKDYDEPMNNKHVIPCVIDFFERDNQLNDFYRKHSRNKIVLVSSPFDYQYLKEKKCPIEIGLFAYSLSDRYAITHSDFEKKYDLVLTGRQDPLLYSFFKEYVKKHPDVTYVKRGQELENDTSKTKGYFLNGKDYLGTVESREDFMKIQAQGRVSLYGVQGYLDGFTKGFYHMTPHFLELIACGCHIIAHYPAGAEGVDAQYYEFGSFSPSIESYEEFESALDNALNTEVDLKKYSSYLKKHYTSTRVKDLQMLLSGL